MSDPDDLEPQQALILEVLDARHALGEAAWTFGPEHAATLTALQGRRLIGVERGTGGTLLAWRATTPPAPAPDELPRRRQRPVADLRRAMADGEITLRYQPQIDVASGRIIAVEALARWDHPQLGLLGPATFMPAAQRGGLMPALTLRVLDLALAQARAWQDGGAPTRVAVNLSASDIIAGFVDDVAAALRRHHASPRALKLEVTETIAMTDPELSIAVLTRLDALGIDVCVDDYGTGHSSLAYLHRLPVRQLKIDRAFIDGMLHDPAKAVIVRSTLRLARELGLHVVAEGVEDAATLRALRDLRCDAAQGYAIARPLTAADLAADHQSIEARLAQDLAPAGVLGRRR